MRKFTVLLLILAMVFPLAIPMVAAQGNGIQRAPAEGLRQYFGRRSVHAADRLS